VGRINEITEPADLIFVPNLLLLNSTVIDRRGRARSAVILPDGTRTTMSGVVTALEGSAGVVAL
jgi:hypothetical protein